MDAAHAVTVGGRTVADVENRIPTAHDSQVTPTDVVCASALPPGLSRAHLLGRRITEPMTLAAILARTGQLEQLARWAACCTWTTCRRAAT